jgi:hypothetical protein
MKCMLIKVKVKVKQHKDKELPDWGLGPGILAEQEVEISDEISKPHISMMLLNTYQDLIKETIEAVYE